MLDFIYYNNSVICRCNFPKINYLFTIEYLTNQKMAVPTGKLGLRCTFEHSRSSTIESNHR